MNLAVLHGSYVGLYKIAWWLCPTDWLVGTLSKEKCTLCSGYYAAGSKTWWCHAQRFIYICTRMYFCLLLRPPCAVFGSALLLCFGFYCGLFSWLLSEWPKQ